MSILGHRSKTGSSGAPGGQENAGGTPRSGHDAFISYSRHDKDFVTRLVDALKERTKQTWVDWEGIIPGEEWLRKIYSAIEGSQAVIVVLSPDALTSENCQLEVAHTTACNKRLIPIVIRDVDPKDCPKEAAAQNWIFFRESDHFENAVDLLIQAMETDQEYVRTHTRLLTRAIEWETNGRDLSYTLSGREMKLAEHWMLNAGTRKPHPTPLQIDYILTSRNAATAKRVRAILAASIVLFICVATLLMVRQNRQRANLNLAQDLRTEAVSSLTNDDAHSAEVLLAKSLTLDDRSSTREMFLAARSRAARLTRVIHVPGSSILAISADGSAFIAAASNGTTVVGRDDANGGHLSAPIEKTMPTDASLSNDGSRFALVTPKGVTVYRTADPTKGLALDVKAGVAQTACFSPDGKTIATAGNDLLITTWNADTGRKIRTYAGHREAILQLAFSPNGRYLASGGWENTVLLWDVQTGRLLHRLVGHEDVLLSCTFSPDNRVLATGSWDNTTRLWDVASGRCLATIRGSDAGITAVAFTPDGTGLYTGNQLGMTRLCDVDSVMVRLAFPGPNNQINAVTVLPDRRSLMIAGSNGDIQVWDIGFPDRRPEVRTLRGHTAPVSCVAMAPDSRHVVSGGVDNTVRLWDARTGDCLRVFRGHTGGVDGVAFAPDGKTFASASRDWTVRIWDPVSGKLVDMLSLPGPVRNVAYFSHGTRLAVTTDDGWIHTFDLTTMTELKSAYVGFPLYSFAVSPTGRMLAVGLGDGTVRIVGAATLHAVEDLKDRPDEVWGLAFAPDGRRLYAGAGDTLALWDVTSKRVIARFSSGSSIWGLAVDPTGQSVAAACEDSTARVWNTRKGDMVTLSTADASLNAVSWANDGQTVAAAGQDHTVRVWSFTMVKDMLDQNAADLYDSVQQSTGLTVGDQQVAPLPLEQLRLPKVTTCHIGGA